MNQKEYSNVNKNNYAYLFYKLRCFYYIFNAPAVLL